MSNKTTLALDPNKKFKTWLTEDGQPEDGAPNFTFKYMTSRQFMAIADVDDDAPVAVLADLIRPALVDWDIVDSNGKKVKFDPNELEDVTTFSELMTLFKQVVASNSMSAEQGK